MEKEFEFKASSVEAAIEKGLKKLKLVREEADIEVVSEESGLFSRATVKITPKIMKDETAKEETNELKEATEEKENTEEAKENFAEEENNGREERIYERRERRDRRNDRPRERIEYFAEEKAKGKEFLAGITKYFNENTRIDAKAVSDEISFFLGGENASVYIGHRGETLDAIQYLVSQYINKDVEGEHLRVTVDADFYRERRKRTLTALAKKIAGNAYATRKEIALEPMNSYERRIIHAALQNSNVATTRSEGEGKDRHVVIVPNVEQMTYGNVSSEFRKKGPARTKSYGQKKRTF